MGIIFRPSVWLRHFCIAVGTLLPKVLEYSSMAAPVYASWGIDTYNTCERKYSIMTSSNVLIHGV
jgi:hypothetical protein